MKLHRLPSDAEPVMSFLYYGEYRLRGYTETERTLRRMQINSRQGDAEPVMSFLYNENKQSSG